MHIAPGLLAFMVSFCCETGLWQFFGVFEVLQLTLVRQT